MGEGLQGDSDQERSTVGLRATKWLRQRLPDHRRERVYQEVLRALRTQGRHLRRLHMSLMAMEMMGVTVRQESGTWGAGSSSSARAVGVTPRTALSEVNNMTTMILDDLVVWIGNGMNTHQTVLDMLRGAS